MTNMVFKVISESILLQVPQVIPMHVKIQEAWPLTLEQPAWEGTHYLHLSMRFTGDADTAGLQTHAFRSNKGL